MNHEELIANLKQLHLATIAKDYAELARLSEQSKGTYEQYLAALATVELTHRRKLRTARLLKEAMLPRGKRLEDYDFKRRSAITEQQSKRLCEGAFVKNAENVVFFGEFGTGKSHLAEGITRALCERGYRCLFISVAVLITSLLDAQKTLSLAAYYRKLDRYDLITLDELGYTPQTKEGADLFFQLISQRYERKSMMITTNLTYSEWDQVFLNPTTTAAAVDRIIHHNEAFSFAGPSKRAEEAQRNIHKKA